jgi:hypothetical protein
MILTNLEVDDLGVKCDVQQNISVVPLYKGTNPKVGNYGIECNLQQNIHNVSNAEGLGTNHFIFVPVTGFAAVHVTRIY